MAAKTVPRGEIIPVTSHRSRFIIDTNHIRVFPFFLASARKNQRSRFKGVDLPMSTPLKIPPKLATPKEFLHSAEMCRFPPCRSFLHTLAKSKPGIQRSEIAAGVSKGGATRPPPVAGKGSGASGSGLQNQACFARRGFCRAPQQDPLSIMQQPVGCFLWYFLVQPQESTRITAHGAQHK